MERNCAGTSIRAPRVLDCIFSAMSCRPCRQRFFGNREGLRRSSGSGKITRSSYGGGLRLVGGSGNTYPFEISTGEEGAEMIVMFQYPGEGKCKLRNLLQCPAPDDLRCSILSSWESIDFRIDSGGETPFQKIFLETSKCSMILWIS